MFKKSLTILIAFLFLFGTAANASIPLKERTPSQNTGKMELSKGELDKLFDEQDKVRIIVELEHKAAIDTAQMQGVKYEDLAPATKQQLQTDALQAQEEVKSNISSENVEIQYLESFTTVVNGFSAEVEYGNVEKIEKIDSVAKVYIANEYKRPTETPEMIYSKELVQAQEAWRDYGYTGEGMVVGVIDTGIDYTHNDMILTNPESAKLTSDLVSNLTALNSLPGNFYTDKVPYGYNYIDKNSEVRDLAGPNASMHGMHVAGTVAANGNEENGGIKGVAPEAQLLALKVFSNDPNMASTWGDIYIKAIDDAIILGADVINMSLGSTASFVNADDPEQKAVKKAVENGVLMAISAGNSAHLGNGWADQFGNPYAENPDYGVVGAPGLSYESLQVASLENSFMDLDAITYSYGETTGKAPFLSASSVHPNDVEAKSFDVVYAGLGGPTDFDEIDVTGKYALIQRGVHAFVDKALNAQNAGAIGVIIYNNADGYVNMASDPTIVIPQLFMLKADGDELQTALEAGETVTITFEGDKTTAANPEAGKMSAFSSWGLTPNLDFKPEITAPGGQIYSTLNNNQYGMMSGTSMAAPHVAGGAALVLQRVDKDFNYTNADRVEMAKNILMNTSTPVMDKGTIAGLTGWEVPYSPRRQGAGLMQLHAALSTPVVVTEATTGEAKVALKEVENQFSFTLMAHNYSTEDVAYDVATNIQTDLSLFGYIGYGQDEIEAQELQGVTILVNGEEITTVNVPANGSIPLVVTVDVTNAKVINQAFVAVDVDTVFPNGYFVEGYVTFTDGSDVNPTLSVPYVGFKGEWDQAPIFDGSMFDAFSYYGISGVVYTGPETFYFHGFNPISEEYEKELIAISPNGDGIQDDIIPVFSLLRNAKHVKFNILNENGELLSTLRTENNLRKHYYDGGLGAYYSLDPARGWDGTLNGSQVEDGQYYYSMEAVIDFPGAEPQTVTYPVKVDTVAPSVEVAQTELSGVLSINASDNENGAGIALLEVIVNDVVIDVLEPETTEYTLADDIAVDSKVMVIAYDYAGNVTASNMIVVGEADDLENDTTIPYVFLESPEGFGIYNSNEITVNGYIVEKSGLKEFTIAGQPVELNYNEASNSYEFSTVLELEDATHYLEVKAIDNADNEAAFRRMIFVDTTPPEVAVDGLPNSGTITTANDSYNLSVTVQDNYDEIRLLVNGNEVYYHEGLLESYDMVPFSEKIEGINLGLVDGDNKFTLKVIDFAGHETVKVFTIRKVSANPGTPVQPPVTVPTPQPPAIPSDQGKIEVDDEEGAANLVVDDNSIEDEINDSSSDDVVIDLTTASKEEGIKNVSAELSANAFKKLSESKKALVVDAGDAKVQLPGNVVNTLANNATGNVKISVNQVNSEDKQNFASKVFDFTITYEKDGEVTTLSSFAEAVTLNLAVSGVKDSRKAAAYYYNEETGQWEYVGGKVVDGSLVFTVNHFSQYAVIENDKTFNDITSNWAKDEIEVLASRMIIKGQDTETFAPNDKLTRSQFALLLVRALNIGTEEYEGIFTDVTAEHTWSNTQIEAAYNAGIITGSNGEFRPNEHITREQMAAMIVRAVDYMNANLLSDLDLTKSFADENSVSAYAQDAVKQAAALGLITGRTSDNTFAPKENTTRAQAAVVIYRLLEVLDEM